MTYRYTLHMVNQNDEEVQLCEIASKSNMDLSILGIIDNIIKTAENYGYTSPDVNIYPSTVLTEKA